MEKFRGKVKGYTVLMVILIVLIPVGALVLINMESFARIAEMSDSFLIGMFSAFEALLVYFAFVNIRALSNEDRMKKLYINSTDERKAYIKSKMAMNTIVTFISMMYIAIIVAGFKNAVVFETLVYVLYAFAILMAINKIILKKKH